jgi:hypothetical protein
MCQRLYPETLPVLASYWLKTVYASGYKFRQWKELNRLMELALRESLPDDRLRQALTEVRNWIQATVLLTGQAPQSQPPPVEPVRTSLDSERVTAYIVRLLNEWLPGEVARLLVAESESTAAQNGGIPVLAIAHALERLLVRQHLSRGTLEMLLEPDLLCPEYVYPADIEILRDIVLSLLGRTWAPIPSVLPATLLCAAPDSLLPADYREALRRAFIVRRPGGDAVHVPIASAPAFEILQEERVRLGSIIVTMDGRWWEFEDLQSGVQHCVVYRPGGRLRIDYSGEHARLRVPWPEVRLRWSGGCTFRDTFKIFGREWRVSKWEVEAERAWLHLMFSRTLSTPEMVQAGDARSHALRSASVDMAWAALESAVSSSLVQKSSEPIERLRQSDLIPLGRAILGLTESIMSRRPQIHEAIETQLRAIRYLESPVVPEYGRVPWRILPGPVRATFLGVRRYLALLGLLNEVFEGLPEALSQARGPRATSYSTSPPHAA